MLTDQCQISTASRSAFPPTGEQRPILNPVMVLSFMLILCLGCSGTSERRGTAGQQGSVIPLHPQTTLVTSFKGETLDDIAHRTGFAISVLERLNPSLAGVRLSRGVEVRCPVGQPGIRRVEKRTSKGATD